MGTKTQFDNPLPGYYSMKDFSRESNGGGWPAYFGDNGFPNGQCYYGFPSRGISDSYPGYDKDTVKQTMLEHEAIFKNQVCELHRLYRVQRDLMDEFRRKERYNRRTPYETSSSSSHLPSQIPSEDALKWNASSLPLVNSITNRLPVINPDIIQSFASTIKGKSIQTGQTPSQKCSSPKDSEASESRPTKYRKKMIDLQLPAEEYLDTEEVEQCGDATMSDTSNNPDGNHKFAPESGEKFFLSYCEKTESHGEAFRPDSGLRKSSALVDLNEPVQVKEATAFPSVDFLARAISRNGNQGQDFSSKILCLPRDISRHGSMNGTSNNVHYENGVNSHCWFPYVLEAEQSNDKLRSIQRGPQPDKVPGPSQPVQFPLEQTHRPSGFLQSDPIKGDSWKAKRGGVFGISERNYIQSGYNKPESIAATNCPSPSFIHSYFPHSWDHSGLLWGKPSSDFSQKSISVHPNPYQTSATSSKSYQLTSQGNELLGTKWPLNGIPKANPSRGNELPIRNGFCPGFLPGSTELSTCFPPVSFDDLNHSNDDKGGLGVSEFFKATSHVDVNSTRDLNLNTSIPNDRVQKQEEPHPILPWLRVKAACFNDNAIRKSLDSHHSAVSTSCDGDVKARQHDINECASSRKILGVPIFEKPFVSKNEVSSLVCPSYIHHPSHDEEIESNLRKGGLDINMPCDPMDPEFRETASAEVVVLEKRTKTRCAAGFRYQIDLNSCASDDEVPLTNSSTSMKQGTGIDLEAPMVVEAEEGNLRGVEPISQQHELPSQLPIGRTDDPEAELAGTAAEVIVSISASVLQKHVLETTPHALEASLEDPLCWFVDIVCSCNDDLESWLGADSSNKDGVREDCLSCESDYFESMTLKLTGCDVEDYLSKPVIPETPNIEGTGTNVLANRVRRGPARRGRQRRDFQRDILPGLASLSRHEVTEDLQVFGELMRAAGHPWHSGPRRNATRNGCARGRRHSAAARSPPPAASNTICGLLSQQLSTPKMGLEDRSLTGWGKTTRRARRQRCPAGNPAPASST
ncbi:hypothetical protein Nepgr_003614 [Nepenthes gracilis]|uniref:Uncharacterized protein n=1 Tax=Nepenthes gracilis TaxID=150966 RepID=A0AAD3RZU6_NEPGR|nr:hypothetical protein Nepgr_003614 [Nepenthes gracilis]